MNQEELNPDYFRHLRFHLSFPRSGVSANDYLSHSSRNPELAESCPHTSKSLSQGQSPRSSYQTLSRTRIFTKLRRSRSREGPWPAPEDTESLWQCQTLRPVSSLWPKDAPAPSLLGDSKLRVPHDFSPQDPLPTTLAQGMLDPLPHGG